MTGKGRSIISHQKTNRPGRMALVALTMIVAMVLFFTPDTARAAIDNNDMPHWVGNLLYEFDDGIYVVGCKPDLTEITVPSRIYSFGNLTDIVGGVAVIGVREGAFASSPYATTVTLGANIQVVSGGAFVGLRCLQEILVNSASPYFSSVSGALLSLDGTILYKCAPGATLFTVPDSVTTITETAFFDCESLNAVVIPDTVATIADGAFSGCTRLTMLCAEDSPAWAYAVESGITCRAPGSGLQAIGLAAPDLMDAGTTATVTVSFLPEAEAMTVAYTSDNTSVATVSQSGVITAKAPGTAQISATAGGRTAAHTLTVTPMGGASLHYGMAQDGQTLVVLSCDTSVTTVTIPERMNGKPVTAIGAGAFSGCSLLTAVTLPATILQIGDRAFQDCTSLRTATLPANLQSIGSCAFMQTGVTAVSMPNSVKSVGEYAYSGCKQLTSLRLSTALTELPDEVFSGCKMLKGALLLPTGITRIGKGAFMGCIQLGAVTLPISLRVIDDDAFNCCFTATFNEMPAMLEEVGEYAFYDTSITSAMLPDSVTELGSSAFSYCLSLTRARVPGAVGEVPSSTFYRCSALREVTLGEGLTAIRHFAFYYCSALTAIDLPGSVTNLYEGAFMETGLQSVRLPISMTSLGDDEETDEESAYQCFYGTPLTTVELPPNLTTWNYTLFENCDRLQNFTQPTYQSGLRATDGVVFSGDGTTLVFCPTGRTGEYTLPAGVTAIASHAFSFSNVETVRFHSGLTTINEYAFSKSGLTGVTIPETVTTLGARAFEESTRLTTATVSYPVVPAGLFQDCVSLRTLTFEASVTHVNNMEVTDGCDAVALITFKNPDLVFGQFNLVFNPPRAVMGYVGSAAQTFAQSVQAEFRDIEADEALFIDGISQTMILGERTQLTLSYYPHRELTQPVSWQITGNAMTLTADGLLTVVDVGTVTITATCGTETVTCTSTTNPDTAAEYSYHNRNASGPTITGFNDDQNKNKRYVLQIPDFAVNVADFAFQSSVAEIIRLPSGIRELGKYAFSLCESLQQINLPDGLICLPECLFWNDISLTTITIPQSVSTIHHSVFNECDALTSILVAPGSTFYKSVNGMLLSANGQVLVRVPGGKEGALSLPEGVTRVENYSLYGCKSLTSVSVPGTVSAVGDGAFDSCSNLSVVTFMEGANHIGEDAFHGCESLSAVRLPRSMDDIAATAFRNTSKVTIIGYAGSWAQTFAAQKGYTFVDVEAPVTTTLTLPESLTALRASAFEGDTSLESVVFAGERVKSIGEKAFACCTALRSVDVPASVTNIGAGAFDACPMLTLTVTENSEAHRYAVEHSIPFTLK